MTMRDPTLDEQEEVRMRALFADADRPPMGDEAFLRSVMGKVERVKASEAGRRSAAALGAAALCAAVSWPFRDAIGLALTAPLQQVAGSGMHLGAGAMSLLLAGVAGLAAWAYAERG